MEKVFSTGRLQINLNDGTKSGKNISIPNMVENAENQTVGDVANAVASLVDYGISEVRATQTYHYSFTPEI